MIIVGHRGARAEAPENTLAGFRYLRTLNIHHVELDVRLSADQQLVVIHDSKVDRTTDHKGYVEQYTADELQAMNAAHHFPHWEGKTGVPLLSQVISEWPELKTIQLEVKTTSVPTLHLIAQKLNALIQSCQLHDKAIVTSSDIKFLKILQQQSTDIRRGLVAERFSRNPIGKARRLGCDYLVIDWRRCSKKLIQRAHRKGLTVSTWTVNNVDVAKRLMSWEADSLITDIPSVMLKMLPYPEKRLGLDE